MISAAMLSALHVKLDTLLSVPSQAAPVAPEFTADVLLEMSFGDDEFPAVIEKSSMAYSTSASRFAFSVIEFVPALGDGAYVNQTQYAYGDDTMFTVQNGQCLDQSAPGAGFESFFSWLPYAEAAGETTVDGRLCSLFNLSMEGLELSLCLDHDAPVRLSFAYGDQNETLTFQNLVRHVDLDTLVPPPLCGTTPPACGDGHIAKQRIYIFHPADNFNPAGQDVGDALGDATFLCSDKLMWVAGGYSLLSVFEVSWVEKFGQYSNCPPDPTSPTGATCVGGDPFYVGRSSAFLLGERQGQCDEDAPELLSRVGSWFSMPQGGQCQDGQTLEDGTCSWKLERRIKTIDMACLFDDAHKVDEMCEMGTAPFLDVAMALVKATDSDNIASGGCPAVEPPAFHDTLVVV